MNKTKDQTISRIVKMEERIGQCKRCKDARCCVYKPLTGRGDVNSDVILVFHSENTFTRDKEKINNMRQEFSAMLPQKYNVYHTYLVRCSPKFCNRHKYQEILFEGTLINIDKICLLTNRTCDAIIVEPDDQQDMNCLHYLLEEIEILSPKIVITLGEKTYQYVFRAFGLFDPFNQPFAEIKNKLYRSQEYFFIPADLPEVDTPPYFQELKPLLRICTG